MGWNGTGSTNSRIPAAGALVRGSGRERPPRPAARVAGPAAFLGHSVGWLGPDSAVFCFHAHAACSISRMHVGCTHAGYWMRVGGVGGDSAATTHHDAAAWQALRAPLHASACRGSSDQPSGINHQPASPVRVLESRRCCSGSAQAENGLLGSPGAAGVVHNGLAHCSVCPGDQGARAEVRSPRPRPAAPRATRLWVSVGAMRHVCHPVAPPEVGCHHQRLPRRLPPMLPPLPCKALPLHPLPIVVLSTLPAHVQRARLAAAACRRV